MTWQVTAPSDLLALATRCETEEPSRALDQLISKAIGYRPSWHDGGETRFYAPDKPEGSMSRCAEPYTSSLDAAVTLVPEGWNWSLEHNVGGPCGAEVSRLDEHFMVSADTERFGNAKTSALALCAAALRARATEEPVT